MSGYGSYPQSSYSQQYGPSNYSSYSNSYPRYNSSYNNNGYNNSSSPYSNNYSKPMPQNPENPQLPPPNLGQDVWGLLNGFQALLNVLYAGTGIVNFGKIFIKMSLKLIKAVCGKSASTVFKLTGLSFLKKIILESFSQGDWSKDFNAADSALENAWGNNEGSTKSLNKGLFGKILLVIRICSMLGTMLALFLRSRTNQQLPPVEVRVVEPEGGIARMEKKQIEFQSLKSLYEEIKLIEEEQESAIKLAENDDVEEVIKVEIEDLKEDQIIAVAEEAGLDKKEIQVVSEDMGSNTLKLLECQLVKSQNSLDEEREIKETETDLPKEILDTMMTSPILESHQAMQVQPQESSFQNNILPKEIKRERIISEDFWRNAETSKQIESLNNKDAQEENKSQVYEAPSMLQELKEKPASNKPWLMKKKRVEV